jgi:mannose-6-phosphate isomerase-like protein (cupin superfamily)
MKNMFLSKLRKIKLFTKYFSIINIGLLVIGIIIGYLLHVPKDNPTKQQPVKNQSITGVIAEETQINVFDLIKNGFQNDKGGINWTVLAEDQTSGIELVSIKDQMPNHIHKTEDHYTYVISGNGDYIQSGKTISLEPGKFILTPMMTPHKIVNKGKEPLLFLVFSTPLPFRETDIDWIKNH